jgi:hypothetical protein
LTTLEEKAHRYEKRERGLELRKKLATLDSMMRDYSRGWSELARAFEKRDDLLFRTNQDGITASYRSFVGRDTVFASAEKKHFDYDKIVELLIDREALQRELAEIKKYFDELGDPL